MQLKIELKTLYSLTTATDIFTQKSSNLVEAAEFSEKQIIFQLPKAKLAVGGLVSLQCVLHMEQSFEFSITGKIVFCEKQVSNENLPFETELMRTGIELRQYNRDLWIQFLRAASSEQLRVDLLLSSMKGSSRG